MINKKLKTLEESKNIDFENFVLKNYRELYSVNAITRMWRDLGFSTTDEKVKIILAKHKVKLRPRSFQGKRYDRQGRFSHWRT